MIHPFSDTQLRAALAEASTVDGASSTMGTQEHIHFPTRDVRDKVAFSVQHVLTETECATMIGVTEAHGYECATINTGVGQIVDTDFRSSSRCIVDSPQIALLLWKRIKHTLPKSFFRGPVQAVGLNERLRFLRYNPGEHFAPHYDGCFRRNFEAGERKGEVSKLTVMLYLNEGFEGGETSFPDPRRQWNQQEVGVDYTPQRGSALIFEHGIYHAGAALRKGTKYAIRTDLMFTNRGSGHDYETEPIVVPKGVAPEVKMNRVAQPQAGSVSVIMAPEHKDKAKAHLLSFLSLTQRKKHGKGNKQKNNKSRSKTSIKGSSFIHK